MSQIFEDLNWKKIEKEFKDLKVRKSLRYLPKKKLQGLSPVYYSLEFRVWHLNRISWPPFTLDEQKYISTVRRYVDNYGLALSSGSDHSVALGLIYDHFCSSNDEIMI